MTTDFDRLRVEGAFTVDVAQGSVTSARLSGSPQSLDAALVEVQGRTLVVRRRSEVRSGERRDVAPAVLHVVVPRLNGVTVSGSAQVRIARMLGPRVAASLSGSGTLGIADISADRLDFAVLGSGKMSAAGKVAQATGVLRGSTELDAGKLRIADLKLVSENAGAATVSVGRSADVSATGSGSVIVLGHPACTVRNIGSGTVQCGKSEQAERGQIGH